MNVVLSSFCVLNLVSVMPARVPAGGRRCPRCERSFQSTRGIAAHAARVHLCYFRGAGGVPVLVDIPADQVPQALMRVRVNAVHARRRPGLRARLERELAAGGWPGPGRHQAGHPAMAAACSRPTSSLPPEQPGLHSAGAPVPLAACPVSDFAPWPDQSPAMDLSFDVMDWDADLDLDPGLADAILETLGDLAVVTAPRDSATAYVPPTADSDTPLDERAAQEPALDEPLSPIM